MSDNLDTTGNSTTTDDDEEHDNEQLKMDFNDFVGRGMRRSSPISDISLLSGITVSSTDSGVESSFDNQMKFDYCSFIKEKRQKQLWAVEYNHFLKPGQPNIFAVVGGTCCLIYESTARGQIKLVMCFEDPDPNEDFYTCCWSRSSTNKTSILLAAGGRGIIRIFHPENSEIPAKHLIGHGQSVNQLKIAHSKPFLLASASKDHSIRLWNIETSVCIATFHGIDSHRDECVSIDFNRKCTQLVSGGNDHMIAIWDLTQSNIAHAIETSQSYNEKTSQHSFKTIFQSFPIFTTRSIHRNYIDCVQWFNNAIFSKSNEDDLICWQPGLLPSDQINGKSSRDSFTRFAKLDVECCTYYFVRFAINFQQTLLAIGDSIGIIRLFNLNVNDPTNIPFVTLKHPKCKQIIRDLAFSRCGRDLICCSDDGTIWLHQLRTNRK